MAFTLEQVQDDILAYLDSQFSQEVIEQGFPDIASVPKDTDGKIIPYISVRFGDERQIGARAMSGAFDDDYRLPLTITAIAGDVKFARRLANKVSRVFIGKTFPWAGQVRKRGGGGMLSATESNSGTEAYAFPKSFDITVQLHVD